MSSRGAAAARCRGRTRTPRGPRPVVAPVPAHAGRGAPRPQARPRSARRGPPRRASSSGGASWPCLICGPPPWVAAFAGVQPAHSSAFEPCAVGKTQHKKAFAKACCCLKSIKGKTQRGRHGAALASPRGRRGRAAGHGMCGGAARGAARRHTGRGRRGDRDRAAATGERHEAAGRGHHARPPRAADRVHRGPAVLDLARLAPRASRAPLRAAREARVRRRPLHIHGPVAALRRDAPRLRGVRERDARLHDRRGGRREAPRGRG
mmetsp:Transcript_7581/g.19957  ORF Transcript_7581/g.19957 Transcript_7581/m.19957 type:complete len:264 (-) Transcript_7581:672-1463(-)